MSVTHLLATRDCATPSCPNEADRPDGLCSYCRRNAPRRFHLTLVHSREETPVPPECKNGCVGRPAVDSRGMYAGLCAECKEAKRAARASKVAVEKGRIVPVPDDRVHWLDVTGGGHGDPGWLEEHAALVELHREKSSTYGTGDDALHNFATVGVAAHKSPERYVVERIIEKCVRALNMIDAGAADHVKEYRDIASLGLVAAALQRRRAT